MELATAAAKAASRGASRKLLVWGQAALIWSMLALLYATTLADLASEWWTLPESSHGLLIPPLVAYIVYLRRLDILSCPTERDWRGLWLSAAGCCMFLLGRLAAEFFLARMSFVVLLAGIAWTFWGSGRMKKLAFPFILLATMVPLPAIVYNSLSNPLQLLSSTIATSLAQQLGVSLYREGNIIHLANVSLGVAEACSGLHSLSALMIGSLLLGFVQNSGIVGRILLLLISVPLAIAVNVIRVTGTALLADVRLEYAMGYYHAFSGWLVFVLGFGVLWMIATVISRPRRQSL
jgi:exosortase